MLSAVETQSFRPVNLAGEQPTALASNIPSFILVSPDATVSGPYAGQSIDLSVAPAGFALIRLDLLIREALEPLGWSITFGSAKDMRETAERLERIEKATAAKGKTRKSKG